ncbi:hypothetical protein R5R35_011445 [Gryllus longicercus]|uniref:Uncharacterized protein n=1 Tax=Gryllus longicercus TaxID=2509291 RepID=A0AAN9V151_9ORTH
MSTSCNSHFDDVKNRAAIKIQTVWRTYHARQKYHLYKYTVSIKKHEAAIVIQRALRRWWYKKWQQLQSSLWNEIPNERRERINRYIEMWRKKNKEGKYHTFALPSENREILRFISFWQLGKQERDSRRRRLESLWEQVEATSLILEGSKSLVDFKLTDAGFYWCPSIALAVEARLRSKRKFLVLNNPYENKLIKNINKGDSVDDPNT